MGVTDWLTRSQFQAYACRLDDIQQRGAFLPIASSISEDTFPRSHLAGSPSQVINQPEEGQAIPKQSLGRKREGERHLLDGLRQIEILSLKGGKVASLPELYGYLRK